MQAGGRAGWRAGRQACSLAGGRAACQLASHAINHLAICPCLAGTAADQLSWKLGWPSQEQSEVREPRHEVPVQARAASTSTGFNQAGGSRNVNPLIAVTWLLSNHVGIRSFT